MKENKYSVVVENYIDETGHIPVEDVMDFIKSYVAFFKDKSEELIVKELLSLNAEHIFYNRCNTRYKERRSWNKDTGKEEIVTVPVYDTSYSLFTRDLDCSRTLRLLVAGYRSEHQSFEHILEAIPRKPDERRYLEACKKLFPNADVCYLGDAATAFRRYIQNIYHNIDPTLTGPQQSMLYHYSQIGGTGKGTFIDRKERFFRSIGLPSATSNLNSRWPDETYAKNLSVSSREFFPKKSNEEAAIVLLNSIIDNVPYTVELKGKQPMEMRSRTTLEVASNRLPYDTNDRRYGVVRYSMKSLANGRISAEDEKYLNAGYTDEDWNRVFYDAFTSCPFDREWSNFESTVPESLTDFVLLARLAADDLDGEMTPRGLVDTLRTRYTDLERFTFPSDPRFFKNEIFRCVTKLVDLGMLEPVRRHSGGLIYSSYRFSDIARLKTVEDDNADYDFISLPNPLEAAAKGWDMLIAASGPADPQPEDRDTVQTEEGFTFTQEDLDSTGMRTCLTKKGLPKDYVSEDTQFLVSATPKKEYLAALAAEADPEKKVMRRRDKDWLPVVFVYESDDISKEQQREKAGEVIRSRYGRSVYMVTDSANKSIHTLVWIDPKDRELLSGDRELHRFVWKAVGEQMFGKAAMDKMDSACSNTCRLTRLPGAIRTDVIDDQKKADQLGVPLGTSIGRGKQRGLYINRRPKGVDISEFVKMYRSRKTREESKAGARSRPACTDWGDTPLMEQFRRIAVKSGTAASLGALEMLETGVVPQGELPMMAIGYLSAVVNYIDGKFMPLYDELYDLCQDQHPSNITKSRESYLEKRSQLKK